MGNVPALAPIPPTPQTILTIACCCKTEPGGVSCARVQVGNVPAVPIKYANDLDIAPDGTVYFTDCSHIAPPLNPVLRFYDTLRAFVLTMAEVGPLVVSPALAHQAGLEQSDVRGPMTPCTSVLTLPKVGYLRHDQP